jgi:hypothetical protein
MLIFSMWKRTAAQQIMSLTNVEREKITDSVLKIQSVRASLEDIHETKIPEYEEIEGCLTVIDKNLRLALRQAPPKIE